MRVLIGLGLTGAVVSIGVLALRRSDPKYLEPLVMPGPVIGGHAKIERRCTECHVPFSKETQDQLCLACHKDVGEDLRLDQGFHGRFAPVKGASCKSCHTDHRGRDADIVGMDRETFRHDDTDFPLRGAHALTGMHCAACHREGKPFRETATDCFSCHQAEDVHQGQLGTDCARCHSEAVWKDARFDHATTRFPLTGKHQPVACYACHQDQTYKGAPLTCVACHLVNDVHDSTPEERCEQCHQAEGWKPLVGFDHDRDTTFALAGRHAEVTCDGCHRGLRFHERVGTKCVDCHQADDVHKGRQGTRCDECHTSVTWTQVTFDHDRDTTFKLLGRHRETTCVACHQADTREAKLDTACASCHQADDVHRGRLGTRCETCHTEAGWDTQVAFDHDLTAFPLIGMHATTACGQCHVSTTFKDVKPECLTCHQADDVHKGTLGTLCASCHNPNSWGLWEFDHDAQTTFKLEGAHHGLDCQACHGAPVVGRVELSSLCVSCHEQDDVHRGEFGRQCERCHTVESFKEVEFVR